jgi:hypothetical protein
VELERFGFTDVSLMKGERINFSLDLSEGDEDESSDKPEVVLLTDKRVIHLYGNGKRRKAIFASIEDINSVELSVEHDGRSTYMWAAVAFIVAISLFFAIDHTVGRVAAALAVGLMGIYLIVDHLMDPGTAQVIFKTGSSQLGFGLKNPQASSNVYPFINQLFQMKGENSSDGLTRAGRFAPR